MAHHICVYIVYIVAYNVSIICIYNHRSGTNSDDRRFGGLARSIRPIESRCRSACSLSTVLMIPSTKKHESDDISSEQWTVFFPHVKR